MERYVAYRLSALRRLKPKSENSPRRRLESPSWNFKSSFDIRVVDNLTANHRENRFYVFNFVLRHCEIVAVQH